MNRSVLLLVAVLASGCASQAADEAVESSDHSIVGGAEAQPGAWPGMVALYKGGGQACAGTLITSEWVLTAAHCVSRTPNGGISKVVAGRHRLSTTEGETLQVDHAIKHPNYVSSDNDLALLHLSTPSTQPPAKLVRAEQLAQVAPGADTIAVGWGRTSEGSMTSDVLREVTVPLISNESCNRSYPNRVTDNMICAGLPEGGKDSCQGDSGGPLFQVIDGEIVEVGIVSWGIGCARPDKPGVYTRVSQYLDWIAEQTNPAPPAQTP